VLAGGQWFLEAADESAALLLANMAVVGGRVPAALTTSAQVGAWLRPHLAATGRLAREETVLSLLCREARAPGSGQWAQPEHLPALRAFDAEMSAAGLAFYHPAWEILIAFREAAILMVDGAVAAVVERFGSTAAWAGITGVRAAPRRQGTSAESDLLHFAVSELLRECPAVHAFAPASQTVQDELLRSAGFVPAATRYGAAFA
jgi:hypothetical protein